MSPRPPRSTAQTLSRRALLSGVGLAFTAGCAASGPTVDVNGDPPLYSPGDSHDAGDYEVTVSNPRVRHGIRKLGTTHVDPHWVEGSQFLVVDVAVAGEDPPDPADLDLAVEASGRSDSPDRRYVAAESNDATRQQSCWMTSTAFKAPD